MIHFDAGCRDTIGYIRAKRNAQNTYSVKSNEGTHACNAFTRSPGTHHTRPLDEQYEPLKSLTIRPRWNSNAPRLGDYGHSAKYGLSKIKRSMK